MTSLKIRSFIIGGLLFSVIVLLFSAKMSTAKSKLGHINTKELWQLMPERLAADEQLKKLESELSQFIKQEQDLFITSVQKFQKDSASMSELVMKQTYNKLLQQQEAISTLPEQANQELTKKQQELYAPILNKMQEAIDAVSVKYGFDYIVDSGQGHLVYVKNKDDDILPLVKEHLGLK
jgi:outer membrane protein